MKNIIPIINGDKVFPSISPNLNHILFKGVRTLEFNRPSSKKIVEIIKDHILKSSFLVIGYKDINKKTTKILFQNFYFELTFLFCSMIIVFVFLKNNITYMDSLWTSFKQKNDKNNVILKYN